MKSEDASQGFDPRTSSLRTSLASLLARPVERGVVANLNQFILVVYGVMVKNCIFPNLVWYFEASQLNQRRTSRARYRAEGIVRSANIDFIGARAHFMSLFDL